MPKVFVINNSGHDYSEAEKFGELVFLTTGKVEGYKVNKNFRNLLDQLQQATEEDYLLVTSLASLNCIAGWILGHLSLPLNLLLFKDGHYEERNIVSHLIHEGDNNG